MKSQVLHTVWCYISGEAAGEIWNWSLLGVKGLSSRPFQIGPFSLPSTGPTPRSGFVRVQLCPNTWWRYTADRIHVWGSQVRLSRFSCFAVRWNLRSRSVSASRGVSGKLCCWRSRPRGSGWSWTGSEQPSSDGQRSPAQWRHTWTASRTPDWAASRWWEPMQWIRTCAVSTRQLSRGFCPTRRRRLSRGSWYWSESETWLKRAGRTCRWTPRWPPSSWSLLWWARASRTWRCRLSWRTWSRTIAACWAARTTPRWPARPAWRGAGSGWSCTWSAGPPPPTCPGPCTWPCIRTQSLAWTPGTWRIARGRTRRRAIH